MKQRLHLLVYLVTQGGRYAWQSLKNCVKRLVGRKPFYDQRMLFFQQYILHLSGLRPIRGITSEEHSRREGAGSQACMIMNTMAFARASGLTYVHTPFTYMDHPARPMEEWVAAWEGFFNFGAGEASREASRRDVANYRNNWDSLELCFGLRGRRDELTECFKACIPEFRRKYYLNKSPRETEFVTVAVHIRRGNVFVGDPFQFTENELVRRTIVQVKSTLESQEIPYRIRVYSQGDIADFPELTPLGAEFFLDTDALETMEELIEADILIMAKSSFSIYAGFICDGIKIFEIYDFPHSDGEFLPAWRWTLSPQSDDWIVRHSDGSIDQGAFERQLHLLMQAKRTAG